MKFIFGTLKYLFIYLFIYTQVIKFMWPYVVYVLKGAKGIEWSMIKCIENADCIFATRDSPLFQTTFLIMSSNNNDFWDFLFDHEEKNWATLIAL